MPDGKRFFLTTAIDYPNSRPHIGTAFEKIGADVQARYRRMEGYDVFFLMGNDENTVKVARKAAELGQDVKAYCDDMARQFQEVWRALDISYDDFIQTSEPRHHRRLPEVHPEGVTTTATSTRAATRAGTATAARRSRRKRTSRSGPVSRSTRRRPSGAASRAISSPCRSSRIGCCSFYEENPDFIQPESRRNEILTLVQERAAGRQHHPRTVRNGASGCRSTRSSRSGSGSTPC